MNRQQRKESNIITVELYRLYAEFASLVNPVEDMLLQEQGYDIFKLYHEEWKYRCKKWEKKFKTVKPDWMGFHATVTQAILSEYYGLDISTNEIKANYEVHPNDTAVKVLMKEKGL